MPHVKWIGKQEIRKSVPKIFAENIERESWKFPIQLKLAYNNQRIIIEMRYKSSKNECLCERERERERENMRIHESQSTCSIHNLHCSSIASLYFLGISLNLFCAPSLLNYGILNFAYFWNFSPHWIMLRCQGILRLTWETLDIGLPTQAPMEISNILSTVSL